MSSTRKSRSVNKRFAKVNEEWPDKDGTHANKNRPRVSILVALVNYMVSFVILFVQLSNETSRPRLASGVSS